MFQRLVKVLATTAIALAASFGSARLVPPRVQAAAQDGAIWGRSPIPEPYAYVSAGSFSGPAVPESPDPLVAYRWPDPKASDALEIFLLRPKAVSADPSGSFENLPSMTGPRPDVTVKGPGSIRLDFGLELAAWVEFDSPDCPGGVEMSISEYNEPGVEKTKDPVKHGSTYRLELNRELYDGVRFAWVHVKSLDRPWHIKGIRAVCQVKPTNYAGSFSCDDALLTKIWYASAYGVKASLCQDYFGAILMERGDRMSWTGDAHPSQAAALVAFCNTDLVKRNIDSTANLDNGIRSYALYWVLSLLDYYYYTGDTATLGSYVANACAKLDSAYGAFGTDPKLRFYGWDERLCAGFEIWFKPSPEAQRAYEMLSIRAWRDFAVAMEKFGRPDLRDKYADYARSRLAGLRKDGNWYSRLGLHSAADAVTTGLLTAAEQEALFEKEFRDRVNRISLSPFNQYFIIQALAKLGKHDDALSTVRDMWGGMIRYGGTTTFEVFRPSWNSVIGPNDAVPNTQCGITSLCHPWGAGPVKWLNEEVLGIVPTSPGFTTYDVLPHLGATLTRVSGTTPTPRGDIRASFDVASGVGAGRDARPDRHSEGRKGDHPHRGERPAGLGRRFPSGSRPRRGRPGFGIRVLHLGRARRVCLLHGLSRRKAGLSRAAGGVCRPVHQTRFDHWRQLGRRLRPGRICPLQLRPRRPRQKISASLCDVFGIFQGISESRPARCHDLGVRDLGYASPFARSGQHLPAKRGLRFEQRSNHDPDRRDRRHPALSGGPVLRRLGRQRSAAGGGDVRCRYSEVDRPRPPCKRILRRRLPGLRV
jgi:hypothetical protein